jgi:NAD(P)-dependent dehydrogenase (short-subunit alcohol dehydrogenase family)
MVPNAGVGSPMPLLHMDLAAWRKVLDVNLDGVFLSIRYAAPAIIAAGGGSIVTLASVTATTGSPLIGHYAAAKAAVVNLTKTAATELRPYGVRVNALLPGFVGTDLVTAAAPGFEEILGLPAGGFDGLIAQKQGRYGTPGEVAEAALFFASSRSSFCTGSELILDGGLDASLL